MPKAAMPELCCLALGWPPVLWLHPSGLGCSRGQWGGGWLANVLQVKCVCGPRPLYTLVNGQAYQFMEAAMS